MKRIFVPILILFVLRTFSVFSQTKDEIAIRFSGTITVEDARKHLSILASDEYEGRETGKEGQKKAAKYIAEHFKNIGLKAVSQDYFQKFPLIQSVPQYASIEINGKRYKNYEDFYIFPVRKDTVVKAKNILFLGYGISDKNYDDYKKTDVKNKILLVLNGEPMTSDSVSLVTGKKEVSEWTTNYRKKSEWARSKGASGLIVINQNFDSNVQFMKHYLESPLLRLSMEKKNEERRKRIFQAGISVKMADEILSFQKTSVDAIKNSIQNKKSTQTFELNLSVLIEIKNKEEEIYSENVIGMIEGKEFPEEVIIITAHYDHLGIKEGKVYNGADDNASGTVAIMEIAEAFSKANQTGFAPKRSVVFIAFSAEEKGLLGSSYYTDNPLFPLSNTVCNLNIDMLGRGDEAHKNDSNFVYIIGSNRHSQELHEINENCNVIYTNLKLDYKYNDINDSHRLYYRSDHYNFAEKGIPVIFYFSGLHNDYHEHTDEMDKINFPLLVRRTQLIFHSIWEIATRAERIKINVTDRK